MRILTVSFAEYAVTVIVAAVVSFKAGTWFAEGDVVIRLIIKYQAYLANLSEGDAAKRIVAWLYWKNMPAKWFDRPEEP